MREQEVYSATLSLPTPVADWWRGRLTATLSYTETVTSLESGEVLRDQVTLQVGGRQNFTLAEDWRLSASGFFRTPSVNGYTRSLAIGALNLALERSLAGGSLTLAVEDALNTLRARAARRSFPRST